MKIAFIAVCGVAIVCLSTLIAVGKDGAITNALLGAVGLLFGANIWAVITARSGS